MGLKILIVVIFLLNASFFVWSASQDTPSKITSILLDLDVSEIPKKQDSGLLSEAEKKVIGLSMQVKAGKRYCLLLALGGEALSSWFQYLPIVEDWAKDEGAEEVRVYGRLGWKRLTGYDIDYVKLVKKL